MVADSLSLPYGFRLRAPAPPRHEPSAWRGDTLRRSLWLRLVFALFVFAAVVMSFASAVGSLIGRFSTLMPVAFAKGPAYGPTGAVRSSQLPSAIGDNVFISVE